MSENCPLCKRAEITTPLPFEVFSREIQNLLQEFQNDHKVQIHTLVVENTDTSKMGEPNFQIKGVSYNMTGY